MTLLIRALGLGLCLVVSMIQAVAAEPRPLSISGQPTPRELQSILGNGWFVYLDGEIDADAGKRLDAFLNSNGVPETSFVILNYPKAQTEHRRWC